MKRTPSKISSKRLLRETALLLAMIAFFGSGSSGYADPELGTGLIPMSAEEWQMLDQATLKVVGVRPNKIGARRLEEHFKSKGQPSFKITPAESFEEEFITSLNWSPEEQKLRPSASLPSSVDNSKLPSFPPVGNQGSLGSCVGWATTYYSGTQELGLINGYNNKSSSAHILSPKWTYNLLNGGNDGGTYINAGYDLLTQNGAATIAQFPYDNNYRAWDLNPQDWIDAISNRMQPLVMVPGLSSPQNLDTIKGLLNNGHVLSIGTWVYSWNFTTIKADPANPNSPYTGQMACTYMNGRNGGHNITIVGYDDNIWIDINGNGQVDPGERGAFLLCNSWGSGWGNNGFVWVSYDAFLETSAVPNGPSAGRVGISQDWGNMAFTQVAKAANYRPSLIGQFTLSQTQRNQISLQGALANPNTTNPTAFFQDTAIHNSGGSFAFNGTTTNVPLQGTFALDFTDLIPVSSAAGAKQYMLQVADTASGNPTVLSSFSLIDKVHNKILMNNQSLNVDNSMQYSSVTYDYYNQSIPDTTPPQVAITSPTNQQVVSNTIQVIANASDNVGISKVDFYVDGTLSYTDTTSPYSFSLDTTKLVNGNHTLNAVAYDPNNNMSTSSIQVNVQNSSPDTTRPQVAITSPTNQQVVSNTIQVMANATDNVAVSKVAFYVDGSLKATDTTSPYMFSLDTKTLTNGAHVLNAIAYDTSNNTASSAVSVNVQNSGPIQENIEVSVQLGTPWKEGNLYKNSANFYITNKGAIGINVPWQLTIKNSSYTGTDSSWNCTVNSVANGTISATVSSGWEVLNPNGTNSVNVGAIISSSSPNFMPSAITINGVSATIKTN